MTRSNLPIQKTSFPDWRLLLRSVINHQNLRKDQLNDSISGIFQLQHIPVHISNKIISSIQAAVDMALQSENPAFDERRVILSIYIMPEPEQLSKTNHNWGFFRVEKSGAYPGTSDTDEHRIDFYLYPDG